MPAVRPSHTGSASKESSCGSVRSLMQRQGLGVVVPASERSSNVLVEDLAICDMYYPTDVHSRRTFRTKEGKAKRLILMPKTHKKMNWNGIIFL